MSDKSRYVPWAPVVRVLDPEMSADQTKATCRILVQNFGEGDWVQAGLVEVPLLECPQDTPPGRVADLLREARQRAFALIAGAFEQAQQFL